MIPIKNPAEIEKMRAACLAAANVLEQLARMTEAGVSTYELDQEGKRLIESYGAKSACHGYRNGKLVYPGYICVSVNDEVIHGIGRKDCVLKDGDLVALDVSIVLDGFVGDNARTVAVGGSTEKRSQKLLDVSAAALLRGIEQAVPGGRVGHISHAIQSHVERNGFSVIREFVGHGVGRSMHEEPQIPNYGPRDAGPFLKAGMTLAIEPMVNLGRPAVVMAEDGWTAVTRDGKNSAHFEHTVLITEDGPEILTLPKI